MFDDHRLEAMREEKAMSKDNKCSKCDEYEMRISMLIERLKEADALIDKFDVCLSEKEKHAKVQK